ncbi:MAG: hypothetical protein BZ137_02320 [Methanosphaera sp. rholeuAM130]|nr:MAG: hypothetical protein BZ137_02320 [Methanosphaera sp. rholeuAM130]
MNNEFIKSELISYLDDEEKELLDPFLKDMIDLKILTDINKDGKIFKFSNGLYYAYFLIRSIE